MAGSDGTGVPPTPPTRRRASSAVLVAVVWLAVLAAAVGGGRWLTINVFRGPHVALYGDSLATQASPYFDALALPSGVTVLDRVYGGTAICDWLNYMRTDASTFRPQAVVIEFSGNALTPCMAGYSPGTPAYDAKYRHDAEEAIGIFTAIGAHVYLMAAPLPESVSAQQNSITLDEMYAALAQGRADVSYVDAGQAVLLHGQFTDTLPCLPAEPCSGPDGTNIVRAPDGVHFCPDGVMYADDGCVHYSSGAYRFAMAMLKPVLAQFGDRLG
jgi:hypothetical protein